MVKQKSYRIQKRSERLQRLRQDRIKFQGILNKAETIAGLADHPGWREIQHLVREKQRDVHKDMENYKNLSEADLKILHAMDTIYSYFITMADDMLAAQGPARDALNRVDNELEKLNGGISTRV